MRKFKFKIYTVIGVIFLLLLVYQCIGPLSKTERDIISVFSSLSSEEINSIDITNLSGRYIVKIKNEHIIADILNSLNTKEKVIGTGPRMKDRYFITIHTSNGSLTFFFRKNIKDIRPECSYGFTFEEIIQCETCTDLHLSKKSRESAQDLRFDDFIHFNRRLPVYRCEALVKYIDKYVDIYEKQNPMKGQVFVLE